MAVLPMEMSRKTIDVDTQAGAAVGEGGVGGGTSSSPRSGGANNAAFQHSSSTITLGPVSKNEVHPSSSSHTTASTRLKSPGLMGSTGTPPSSAYAIGVGGAGPRSGGVMSHATSSTADLDNQV